MRKFYLFLLAAVCSAQLYAQNEVFFDDFESNSLEGYTLYNLDGLVPDDPTLATMEDSAWTVKFITSAGWQHGLSAFSVSWYVNDDGPSDDWLITPALNVAGNVQLTWDAIAITSSGNFRDRYQVYVTYSNDIDEIFNDVNTLLVFDTGEEGEIASPTSRSIDLTGSFGIENQTIYLAFRNFTASLDGNELAIDNIRVTDDGTLRSTASHPFQLARVQPNPAYGAQTNVLFQLEKAEDVVLELIDLTGKVVSVQRHGILGAGSHQLTIPRAGMAKGIYMVRLRSEQQSRVMKVAFH